MFIAANWKMNGKLNDIDELIAVLEYVTKSPSYLELVLCLPATLLYFVSQKIFNIYGNDIDVYFGGQDVHWEECGAYTGDISASMLYDSGARYVILGHCERRKYHFETNNIIAKKAQAALGSQLKSIICIGEKLEEQSKRFEIIEKQLFETLPQITAEQIKDGFLTIAYEPVWAIGTGKIPLQSDIQEVHKYINSLLESKYGAELSKHIKIIYGGSVNSKNVFDIVKIEKVDGILLGGASLKAEDFIPLIQNVEKINLAK